MKYLNIFPLFCTQKNRQSGSGPILKPNCYDFMIYTYLYTLGTNKEITNHFIEWNICRKECSCRTFPPTTLTTHRVEVNFLQEKLDIYVYEKGFSLNFFDSYSHPAVNYSLNLCSLGHSRDECSKSSKQLQLLLKLVLGPWSWKRRYYGNTCLFESRLVYCAWNS